MRDLTSISRKLKIMNSIPKSLQILLFILSLSYAFLHLGFAKETKSLLHILYFISLLSVILYQRELFKTLPPLIILFGAITTVISWALMKLQIPELANSSPNTKPLLDKLIFIPLALALLGNQKKIMIFWSVAALSALLLPWSIGHGSQEIEAAIAGQRTGFGRHPITMGMIYSCLLIAALVFFNRIVLQKKLIWLRFILWLFIVAIGLLGIIGSQTRAVYVGLFIVLIAITISLTTSLILQKNKNKKTHYSIIPLFLIVSAFTILYSQGTFDRTIKRFISEKQTYAKILQGDTSSIPLNSAGYRIHFWQETLKWSAERPLTGWDDDANSKMHEKAGHWLSSEKRHFITVHNDFLEILLAYGVLGIIFIVTLIFWLIQGIISAWRSGIMPTDYFIFFISFFIFFLFNGLFMSTWFLSDSKFLWNTVTAGAAAFIIENIKNKNASPPSLEIK